MQQSLMSASVVLLFVTAFMAHRFRLSMGRMLAGLLVCGFALLAIVLVLHLSGLQWQTSSRALIWVAGAFLLAAIVTYVTRQFDIRNPPAVDTITSSFKRHRECLVGYADNLINDQSRLSWLQTLLEQSLCALSLDSGAVYVVQGQAAGMVRVAPSVGHEFPETLGSDESARLITRFSRDNHVITIRGRDPEGLLFRIDINAEFLVFPLARDEQFTGLLVLLMDSKKAPEQHQIDLVQSLCDMASMAWQSQAHSFGLNQHEAVLQQVMDNTSAVIYAKDRQGRYILINREFERLFKVNRQEVYGKTDLDLFPPEYAEHFRAADRVVLDTARPAESEEIMCLPDGEDHIFLSIKFPLYDETSNLYAVCNISTDITTRKRAEYELFSANQEMEDRIQERTTAINNAYEKLQKEVMERRRMQDDLISAKELAEQANRAKSDFLSGMSHELRTPLNAILGYGQLLAANNYQPDRELLVEAVDEILHSGQHLLELINEVLDVSRIEAGKLSLSYESVRLREIVDESIAMLSTMAEKNKIALRCESQLDEHFCVYVDRTRLRQIILNLVSNAIKYNRSGGWVKLILSSPDNERIRIAVEDTGVGIEPSELPLLFEPFARLRHAEEQGIEGTGIGLTITRQLTEMMSGTIKVNSEPGVGTVVWVDFPMHQAAVHQPDEDDENSGLHAIAGMAQEHCRLLYVEDNTTNMCLMRKVIQLRPHIELLEASNGYDGLSLARREMPDVVILDIDLPGLSGYEVLGKLKSDARFNNVPVIALTADAMPDEVARGQEAGFSHYLTKPLQIDHFLKLVDNLMPAKAQQSRARPPVA